MESLVHDLRTGVRTTGESPRIPSGPDKVRHINVNLVVRTAGKDQGRRISISVYPFRIGRDSTCHLRPASPIVSKRHCTLSISGNRLFLEDSSTNGTFVDGQRVEGEMELQNAQRIEIGPLAFDVLIEGGTPVNEASAVTHQGAPSPDDTATELPSPQPPPAVRPQHKQSPVDGERVRPDSTVNEWPMYSPPEPEMGVQKPAKPAETPVNDSSTAAKRILEDFLRRKRK
jgi:pSer/pThr/pTyr-binding forkhead associated (FHA) protein